MNRDEALKLLGTIQLGRVAFTEEALPAIPVNHLVGASDMIVRTHGGSGLLGRALASEVVAYEADEIDAATRTGWSVVVTGTATQVVDPVALGRYQDLLMPWVDTEMRLVVRIKPDMVSDYRLVGVADS
ncbi:MULTISPECIES: pyridoxamine 5'-phosphate oxidase family protein [unclassified Streptomyces]|uniref:pyridoxamine 5'-phosphate oxidase family protein n=1 Tax=unclassified Streptomyces TaxID=2593676 RepID=UPI002259D9AB|nr:MULTISPECIES: pyridoxamine 5'-phosphate oxidase family protein [unclassified Streptomyces]MCX5328052.1 pyridoxamine 5'-phosphate oxidase family protein [Streptomyces sp. NBC_00140]MCX5357549.1 pyridoxamine 5'-phosphate oxidase family protein [Streptomyces sp. NBC_00124]